jgi:hypothetical protein
MRTVLSPDVGTVSIQATLLVADSNNSFELTGNGDVLEPESGVLGTSLILCSSLWTALTDVCPVPFLHSRGIRRPLRPM